MVTYNEYNVMCKPHAWEIMQSHFEVAIKTSDKNCVQSAKLFRRVLKGVVDMGS